jgi:Kinesin-associated protein (KAP)
MEQVDDYLELLYEVSGATSKSKSKTKKDDGDAISAQVKGTAMIRKLCRVVMNLEQLIQNGTVMGALTRVFQEDFKKSPELSFNILRIFLAFSNFMEMHGLMANYRIGLLTMKVSNRCIGVGVRDGHVDEWTL